MDVRTVVTQMGAVATAWEREAGERRARWAADPVASSLDSCAGELRAAVRAAEVAMLEDTVEEFAAAHQRTAATVRRWCRQHLIDCRKTSKGWMIRRGSPLPVEPSSLASPVQLVRAS